MKMRSVKKMEMCTKMENNKVTKNPDLKGNKPVIYIAGRFSDGNTLNEEEKWKNRNVMRYYAIKFMKRGYAVICPIENDEWAYEDGIITYEDTLDSDLAIIERCDAIFFCPGWEKGKGTLIEHEFASDNGIEILTEVPGRA
jgi:hypothetical protein